MVREADRLQIFDADNIFDRSNVEIYKKILQCVKEIDSTVRSEKK